MVYLAKDRSLLGSIEDGKDKQLLHQGLCHSLMTEVVRVKAVGFGIIEELGIFVSHRVEAAEGIHINDRHSPDV